MRYKIWMDNSPHRFSMGVFDLEDGSLGRLRVRISPMCVGPDCVVVEDENKKAGCGIGLLWRAKGAEISLMYWAKEIDEVVFHNISGDVVVLKDFCDDIIPPGAIRTYKRPNRVMFFWAPLVVCRISAGQCDECEMVEIVNEKERECELCDQVIPIGVEAVRLRNVDHLAAPPDLGALYYLHKECARKSCLPSDEYLDYIED